MGGKHTSTSDPKLNGIQVQSSTLGIPLTIGAGTNRFKLNLIWYNAFTAIPHTTTQSSGKGFGGSSSNTSYTYTASIIMAIGEGPIESIRTVYRDKSVFTSLAAAGLSLATGTPTQPVWSYLTSLYPAQARAYARIAYVYAQDYALNDSATLPNHSMEGTWPIHMTGLLDADPADWLTAFLTNTQWGLPGWTSGLLGDWSEWSTYCRANNLLVSPLLESQVQASAHIQEIADITNSAPFWSEGLLKIRPYGDRAATGNGVTFTPNLTPQYDLTEDDFLSPVQVNIIDQSDAYNVVQVEFLDRAHQYDVAVIASFDDADIFLNGVRKQDPTTWHSIVDGGIAQHAADLLKNRTLYKRNQYSFSLPWDFVLLEPMDLVTLTTTTDELKLTRQLVRILQIDEISSDDTLAFTAEHVDVGVASAAARASTSGSGYSPNFDVAPGSVSAPVLFNAPPALTTHGPEIWCGAASTSPTWGGCEVWISVDGTKYDRVGTINGPARFGYLSANLALHADPDTTNTLSVNLSASLGALGNASGAGADAGGSMCLVDNEIVTYQTATLTGAHLYGLTTLHRGFMGTYPAAHTTGAPFVRLDDAIFKFAYAAANVGSSIHVKLPSFNVYARALEDISTLPAYTVGLAPVAPVAPASSAWALTGGAVTSASGAVIPALFVSGSYTGAYAEAIITEYRTVTPLLFEDGTVQMSEAGTPLLAEGGAGAWVADTTLDPGTVSRTITNGIAAQQVYQVAISYRTRGQVGDRLILGPVTVGSLGVARACYTITGLNPGFPVTSDDTHIYVAAFTAVLDDGRAIACPAATIGSLTVTTTYGVFWRFSTSAYEVDPFPALSRKASSDYVYICFTATSSGGTYTPPTAPPPGYRGDGINPIP
jgi:hypothetical protein